MGHEFSAEVVEAGPGTDTYPAGTLVTSIPALLSGAGAEMIVYSNTTLGGYAERMLLSAPLLLPVPNGLDPGHAALTEPVAVGPARGEQVRHGGRRDGAGVRLRADRPGDHRRPARHGHRRDCRGGLLGQASGTGRHVGAHRVLDPAQDPPLHTATPAVVFEAVGVPGMIDDVLRRAPAGTRVVVAGVCMQPDTVHPFFAIAKEINIQFVFAYDPPEFAESLRAIAEGGVDVAAMITGRVGLDGVAAAFDDLADPERHCKILVTP